MNEEASSQPNKGLLRARALTTMSLVLKGPREAAGAQELEDGDQN